MYGANMKKVLGCLPFEDGTNRLFRNGGKHLPTTLRYKPEERRPYIPSGGGLCSRKRIMLSSEVIMRTALREWKSKPNLT